MRKDDPRWASDAKVSKLKFSERWVKGFLDRLKGRQPHHSGTPPTLAHFGAVGSGLPGPSPSPVDHDSLAALEAHG